MKGACDGLRNSCRKALFALHDGLSKAYLQENTAHEYPARSLSKKRTIKSQVFAQCSSKFFAAEQSGYGFSLLRTTAEPRFGKEPGRITKRPRRF